MLIYLTYSKKEVAVGEIMKYFFKTIVSLQKEANFSALSCHAITLYTLKISRDKAAFGLRNLVTWPTKLALTPGLKAAA